VLHDCLLHSQRRITRAHRMILMRDRRPEQRHDAVAHDLVDGPLVAMDRFHHVLKHGVENLARFFRITIGEQLHGALKVGEAR
jgi:hypothetical protein